MLGLIGLSKRLLEVDIPPPLVVWGWGPELPKAPHDTDWTG